MIIVEGPDNSGKSTLCRKLESELGFKLVHSGGRPDNTGHMKLCIKEQVNDVYRKVIRDRVTPISDRMYRDYIDQELYEILNAGLNQLLRRDPIIIYCRPSDDTLFDMSSHMIKSYDTEEQIAWLNDNHRLVVDRYDKFFGYDIFNFCISRPIYRYDYTVNFAGDIIESIKRVVKDLNYVK